MYNEISTLIFTRNKWIFIFLNFFSVLGIFYLVSILINVDIDVTLALSMSLFTTVTSFLFTANSVNSSNT